MTEKQLNEIVRIAHRNVKARGEIVRRTPWSKDQIEGFREWHEKSISNKYPSAVQHELRGAREKFLGGC